MIFNYQMLSTFWMLKPQIAISKRAFQSSAAGIRIHLGLTTAESF